MSKRSLEVTVCRGCCCGSADKHPEVDHQAQVKALRAAAQRAGGRLRVADCLDKCEVSNVVVVRPRGAAKPVWFGRVLVEDDLEALAGWVAEGATGPCPETFVARVERRPRG